jgi:hypothetical protein
MTLYHVTPICNVSKIVRYGLRPQKTQCVSSSGNRCLNKGVFGFTNMASADDFAELNNYDEYAIFTFDTDQYIIDPEYDDKSAIFAASSKNIKAILAKEAVY